VPKGGVVFVKKGSGMEVLIHEIFHMIEPELKLNNNIYAAVGVGIDWEKSFNGACCKIETKKAVRLKRPKGQDATDDMPLFELATDCRAIDY
jgi:hypothetical protein